MFSNKSSLYNFSQRPVASRHVSTSSGTTTSGRRHVTVTSEPIGLPPVPPANEQWTNDPFDIDEFQPSALNEDGTETVANLPGVRVAAKPPPARRYANSVSSRSKKIMRN